MPNLDHETLATFVQKGATRCHFKKNQIILYEAHIPAGIFIITSGEVLVSAALKAKIGIKQRIVCDENILILPSTQNVNRKSSIQAKALRNCKAWFVPRSIVFNDKSLYTLIEEWRLNAPVEWEQI